MLDAVVEKIRSDGGAVAGEHLVEGQGGPGDDGVGSRRSGQG